MATAKPKASRKVKTSAADVGTVSPKDEKKNVGLDPTRQALQAKMLSAAYGEIVSILMRSPHYKHYSLADLEWLVIPPLLAKQFTLAEARNQENGIPTPVGVALWARVSEEVDEKLSNNLEQPFRLRPDEWTSGEIYWLIDAIGVPQAVKAMVERMGGDVFKGKSYKLRSVGKDGKVTVQAVTSKSDSSAMEATKC